MPGRHICLLFLTLAIRAYGSTLDTSGFSRTALITFSGYSKTTPLTNFPALVVLNTNITGFSYSQFMTAGGGDLRFADRATNELNYEVETWNTNGASCIWVQVPLLTNGTAIRAYWGETGLLEPVYTTDGSTWNDGSFVGVWHMQTEYVTDASSNGHNATSIDNPAAVTSTPGVIGTAQAYTLTGAGGRTAVGDIELTDQTLSAWVEVPDSSNWGIFMCKDDGQTFFWNQGTTLRFETQPWGGDTTADISRSGGYGNWIHFAATVSGTTQKIYTNGTLAASWTKQVPVPTTATWELGGGPFGRPLNGKLDECRAERTARSADWIWACWRNQSAPAQFETFGTVASQLPSLVVNSPVAAGVTTNSADLGATIPSADGVPVTSWGTFLGTAPSPIGNPQVVTGPTNAPFGFSLHYPGLSAGSHYYFRAWASNSVTGLRYSPDAEFYTEPDPATGLIVSGGGSLQLDLAWTPSPAARGYLVLIQPGLPVTALPQDGVVYTANSTFGLGSDLGGGQYVIYAGSGTSVTVRGLSPYTSYYTAVYAYSGSGSLINYQQDSPATGGYVPTLFSVLQAVQVDPAKPLTNYTTLGGWDTNGNFEGWTTTNVSGATVSGGWLSGFASANNPQVALLNLTNGPDLDLAFNDYVDVRMQVSSNFAGSVDLYYGATGTAGFSASRVFSIANTNVPKDGAFHVYRLFVGPQFYWRGNLTDVRLDPLGASATNGQTFAIDYIRVGDLAGDIYYPRYSSACPGPGTNDSANNLPVMDMVSKHFRVLWDNWDVTNFVGTWSTNMPHGTLRNLEECWKNHIWYLGYVEPTTSMIAAYQDGKKRKVNLTMFYGGYWMGGDSDGFGYLNITPDGLRVDPPTWVPPHEFGHVCQMHQGGGYSNNDYMGNWWEGHANYFREQWLYSIYSHCDPDISTWSGLSGGFACTAHLFHGHGVHYYDHWPIFLYLDENPENLPELVTGPNGRVFSARLWHESTPGEYIYNTISRLAPVAGVKDIMGYYARRSITWDYSHQAAMQATLNQQDTVRIRRNQVTELRQRADDPSWWQVPPECAPMQYAYAAHQLVPAGSGAGRVVTVNFHGLSNPSRQADWRVSFVVVNDSGATRYSPLWNSGSSSVTLAADENQLYLVVAATPTQILPQTMDNESYPFPTAPARERFPYEIQVFGGVPLETTNSTRGLVQHPNGGGWKSTSASVAGTAYLGPNARVLGSAQVSGNARIEDYAVVQDNAVVGDNAVVSGHALLRDSASARQNARVRDYALLADSSVASGQARVGGHGFLFGDALVTNSATVKGSSVIWDHDPGDFMGGDAVMDGDCINGNTATNGFHFGWEWGGLSDATLAAHTAPPGLFAAYEFAAADTQLAHDLYGCTDGLLHGNPIWNSGDAWRAGFLSFSGTNDFVALDRYLTDFQALTITAWVKWNSGAPNQPVWFFGAGANQCFWLTPDDGSGHAKLVVRSNSLSSGLTLPLALPIGTWAHVAVTWSNSYLQCYLNGARLAQGDVGVRPDQLLPANANTSLDHCYLARGADPTQPYFKGALDSVRFYSRVLSDLEIAGLIAPAPPATNGLLAQYLFNETNGVSAHDNSGNNNDATLVNNPIWTNGALAFDGAASYVQTPVPNGSSRTLAAWIYPHTSDAVSYIESVFDTDVPGQYGSGWGLSGGKFRAILDDQFWDTGVVVTLNQWQHVTMAFDQNVARFYVNGALLASLNYTQGSVTSANYKLGKSNANPLYFDGLVRDARIYSRRLSDGEVLALVSSTPPTASSMELTTVRDTPVAFALNATAAQGVSMSFTLGTPTNGVLSGVAPFLIYTPNPGFTGTDGFSFQASDGQSAVSARVTISVRAPMQPPLVTGSGVINGVWSMTINGVAGWTYSVQASTALTSPPPWITLLSTNAPPLPFVFIDTQATNLPTRFYRVLIGP